ncbi:hypothetical protein PROFUN_08201 [Planoprotostelium fungivorum]|uniref:Uncharacterized protein n=1 Tax=Planoprotostelium fungivorum TaxID=1890364 RepID=A0A2P6N665_9EUKA|nr:hypothetical protein PROFUN_08201 [Planoprotostelium fungivorum]
MDDDFHLTPQQRAEMIQRLKRRVAAVDVEQMERDAPIFDGRCVGCGLDFFVYALFGLAFYYTIFYHYNLQL